jgi:hypothetical protein
MRTCTPLSKRFSAGKAKQMGWRNTIRSNQWKKWYAAEIGPVAAPLPMETSWGLSGSSALSELTGRLVRAGSILDGTLEPGERWLRGSEAEPRYVRSASCVE